ncbi:MAG: type II secretion system protein [Planctomycetes bacterium]|nr:type II secretion system protein [Planctomycetota bacterium]
MKRTSSSNMSVRAFTVIELLVVVSIIALLVGILLPAIGKARDQARVTISLGNLRNLATANASYSAEFADRQFTLVNDSIGQYGTSVSAFNAYYQAHGGTLEDHTHPGPILGWGYLHGDPGAAYLWFVYRTHESGDEQHGAFNAANAGLNLPVNFGGAVAYFGSFRLPNVQQLNQYVNGKFYDKIFYAPKDVIPLETITTGGYAGANCFDDPGEYCDRPPISGQGEIPVWSSYCFSPAAMLNPLVMARNDPGDLTRNGFQDPWTLPGGYRSPAMSQALHPSLKTHMIEHHWLQNRAIDCNPGFTGGPYSNNCEPYYFNHSSVSAPATLFYDGHVSMVGIREAMRADGRVSVQTGGDWGLWSRDTFFGNDGYLIPYSYDQANTSFHILTTDGIRGRDFTTN